ncbi:MAG: hypothetical protein J0M08_05730 [Bacteroidetes bacterium]|nr:hypothetical protein [Bacteroidota bacterium]
MKLKFIFTVLVVALFSIAGYSQCQTFSRQKCYPKLKPYIANDQLYSTTMLNDTKIEVPMTFYYGDEYRMVICAEEQLGKIELNLKDMNNNVIYTTKSYGTIMWDFNVDVTQDLTIEIKTQEGSKEETLDKSGCVTILVGFK